MLGIGSEGGEAESSAVGHGERYTGTIWTGRTLPFDQPFRLSIEAMNIMSQPWQLVHSALFIGVRK